MKPTRTALINTSRIDGWLAQLAGMPSFPNAEHLYRTVDTAGRARAHNLREYLLIHAELQPNTLLVGEAPGYRGTRRTGLPFVSESMLRGAVPGVVEFFSAADLQPGVQDGVATPAEVTSAAVWRALSVASAMPLLWATYPHHPHQPGDVLTNRTPTIAELEAGKPLLVALIELFEINTVVAVGNVAERMLRQVGIPARKVRHPARGGATIFTSQISELLS